MFDSHEGANRALHFLGRRAFLMTCGAALAGFAGWRWDLGEPSLVEAAPGKSPKLVAIVEFTDGGERKGLISVPLIKKTEAEWKMQLSLASFEVTRHGETEKAFTGEYLNLHADGVYRCICCGTAAYSSKTKFESGTGWPSFWVPIAKENIKEFPVLTLGVEQTAVSCRACESHLGHVFNDGPQPTGLRYCMNSVALRFAKAT